jgi:hypothetical protein
MPNHVTNVLLLNGSEEDIQKIMELASTDEHHFAFEGLVPMPTQIRHTKSPSPQTDEVKFMEMGKEQVFMENSTEDGRKRLVSKFGTDNWYDWALENWGTKWGAYDSELLDEGDTYITYSFLTAWCYPEEFMREFSRRFPEVSMEIRFADENFGSNCGICVFEGGEMTGYNVPIDGSEEAFEIAGDILGEQGEWSEEEGRYIFGWEKDEEEEE